MPFTKNSETLCITIEQAEEAYAYLKQESIIGIGLTDEQITLGNRLECLNPDILNPDEIRKAFEIIQQIGKDNKMKRLLEEANNRGKIAEAMATTANNRAETAEAMATTANNRAETAEAMAITAKTEAEEAKVKTFIASIIDKNTQNIGLVLEKRENPLLFENNTVAIGARKRIIDAFYDKYNESKSTINKTATNTNIDPYKNNNLNENNTEESKRLLQHLLYVNCKLDNNKYYVSAVKERYEINNNDKQRKEEGSALDSISTNNQLTEERLALNTIEIEILNKAQGNADKEANQIEESRNGEQGDIGGRNSIMSFGSLHDQDLSKTRNEKCASLMTNNSILYDNIVILHRGLASCMQEMKTEYYKKTEVAVEVAGSMSLAGLGGYVGYIASNSANLSKESTIVLIAATSSLGGGAGAIASAFAKKVCGGIIPAVKRRFGIPNNDKIEALKDLLKLFNNNHLFLGSLIMDLIEQKEITSKKIQLDKQELFKIILDCAYDAKPKIENNDTLVNASVSLDDFIKNIVDSYKEKTSEENKSAEIDSSLHSSVRAGSINDFFSTINHSPKYDDNIEFNESIVNNSTPNTRQKVQNVGKVGSSKYCGIM